MTARLIFTVTPRETLAGYEHIDIDLPEVRVGSCRCRYMAEKVVIYSIQVFPEFQGHGYGAAAIDMDNRGLGRIAVAHMRDVTHEHRRAIDCLDRQIVEIGDRVRGIVEFHHILVGADLDVTSRNDLGLIGDRGLHIGGGNVVRLHRLRIEVDLDLAGFAAIRRRKGSAWHRDHDWAHRVLRQIEDLLL